MAAGGILHGGRAVVMLQIAVIGPKAALFGRGQAAFRFSSGMTWRANRSMPSTMG
jgi:hypothetical protein